MVFGWLTTPGSTLSSSDILINWSSAAVTYVLLVTVIFFSISLVIQSLERTIASQKLLSAELDIQRKEMEDHVQLRTKELQRRAAQLEVASQIAHSIALEKNVEPLLNKSVNLIRDQFGFYHAGIFLLDEENEFAVLKAATGEAGGKLLAQGHKLKSGEQGIVGYVTSTGEPRIALDVGTDAVHFEEPIPSLHTFRNGSTAENRGKDHRRTRCPKRERICLYAGRYQNTANPGRPARSSTRADAIDERIARKRRGTARSIP